MMENRGLSDWNGINSEIENEKTAQSNNDRSGPTARPSEASLIDRAKAPKVGSENSRDFLPVAAPERPDSEAVSARPSFFPTMSLEEAASVMRNDLSFNSQGWGALRSPILDVITGKACFSLGSALVSGIVANCGIEPSQTVGSIEDVYWKAVGDDLSKWKNAAQEVNQKIFEYPSQIYNRAKEQYNDLKTNFRGIDVVMSAYGADMAFPIWDVDKGWRKGIPPTVNFSSTLTGIGISFNFANDNVPVVRGDNGVDTNQIFWNISPNVSFLRYFGVSFNRDHNQGSCTIGYSTALPVVNISTTSDNVVNGISYYGTRVGRALSEVNDRFVKQADKILFGK